MQDDDKYNDMPLQSFQDDLNTDDNTQEATMNKKWVQKVVLAGIVAIGAVLAPLEAIAVCVTNVIYGQRGEMTICTTCCSADGTACTTTCL